jgi:hypothetical protein
LLSKAEVLLLQCLDSSCAALGPSHPPATNSELRSASSPCVSISC